MTDERRPEDARGFLGTGLARGGELHTATPGNRLPDQAWRRPCARIEPDHLPVGEGLQTLEDRWNRLTMWLPLRGSSVLRRTAGGELVLVQALRARAPWMNDAIASVSRQLEVQLWTGRPWLAFRPLLLVGPPGSGKSRFAGDLARLAGTGELRVSLSGTSDARLVEGTARGWTGAQPCLPAVAMSQASTANPCILLEEIDKAGGSDRHGRSLDVLLNMLEEHTAKDWYDPCLLAPVDISAVLWIMTANDVRPLSGPLLSRLDIVHVSGPEPQHFDHLMESVLADIGSAWGLSAGHLPPLRPEVRRELRRLFERDRSARALARRMEAALAAVIPITPRALN